MPSLSLPETATSIIPELVPFISQAKRQQQQKPCHFTASTLETKWNCSPESTGGRENTHTPLSCVYPILCVRLVSWTGWPLRDRPSSSPHSQFGFPT